MKAALKYIFIAFIHLSPGLLLAQFNPDKICTVVNGKTIFTLDLRWSAQERNQLMKLFDLDSLLINKVYAGETKILFDSLIWQVKKTKPHIVELSKELQHKSVSRLHKNDVFFANDNWVNIFFDTQPLPSKYGINILLQKEDFKYQNNIARFFLRGHKNSKKVFLSGSFNNWNTSATAMAPCDSGWNAKLKLLPGKYTYKFVVDGKWSDDQNNKLREKDGKGNYNSVIFCYNYAFEFHERNDAKKVLVAGSFNNWNREELRMIKTPGGWILPLYLSEGIHDYKFIVDGEWITDPANKMLRPDGKGNFNSLIGIGEAHSFRLKGFIQANKVILTGNFNAWNREELEMEKISDGWQLSYILPAGMFEYKFIVDGQWMPDPENPYSVGLGNFKNSVLAYKANHAFILTGYPFAKTVVVTGNFNKWSQQNYRMILKDGKWVFPAYLSPGKCLYKFIVDGQWIIDPANKLWEENEYGTNNSVLWIAQ
jgi:hypothetical protein